MVNTMNRQKSPVIANYFMEVFEHIILEKASFKPSVFYRYVDDTFVVWHYGRLKLDDFLGFLISFHQNICFIMEVEAAGQLPFGDILVYQKSDGSLGLQVDQKRAHTDLYLNEKKKYHHTTQKR